MEYTKADGFIDSNLESEPLEPLDKQSRIPNLLAFIIYRVLPMSCFCGMIYYMITHPETYVGSSCIWMVVTGIPIETAFFIGLHNIHLEPDTLNITQKDVTRSEKISKLLAHLETYNENSSSNFSLGLRRKKWTTRRAKKEIQLQKERLAIYLSGSRKGIPLPMSIREFLYIGLTWILGAISFTCILRPEIANWDDLRKLFLFSHIDTKLYHFWAFICGLIFLVYSSYQVGYYLSWYNPLGWAARDIRCFTHKIDYGKETAFLNKRMELEWWIEEILKEKSDSFTKAEERKRVIIAPIQSMICESTMVETAVDFNLYDENMPKVQRCTDCGSRQCCLSAETKLD